MSDQKENLGKMLLAANLIDEVQMQIALAEQKRTGKKFGSTLVDLKFIDENVLAAFLSRQIDVPCISLLNVDIQRKLLRRIPARAARELQAVPIRAEGDRLEIAMVDPTDEEAVAMLERISGTEIIPLIAPQSSIEKMIERLYPETDEEDTISTRGSAPAVTDPMFMDLIEEVEYGDLDERMKRIEETLGQVWTLLEKILRALEAHEPAVAERLSRQETDER
ncbi:MAG: hypothetical protein WBX15_04495 [Thermoanaerobaculia bacterium]